MDQLENWPLERLIEYARNPRKNDHAVDKVASAIREFGFRVPVLAKSDGSLVDGHLRLKAARKLGMSEVPVLLCDDMTDAQIKAFRLSVNRVAEEAGWDDELLRIELDELDELGFDLELTGFSLDEIDALQVEPEPEEGLTDEDAVPEAPEQPVTVEGDVWLLGNHRLMCGDSTSVDAVERLVAGERADMVFTDPPYGIGGYAGRSGKFEAIKNDELGAEELTDMLRCIPDAKHKFIWTTWSTYHVFVGALGVPDSLIVWLKPWPGMGKGYRGKHEFCMFYGECDRTDIYNVWENGYEREGVNSTFDRTAKCNLHPTQKPVALAEFAIENHNPSTVIDLFGGSGSTLIACEKTGRDCRMMELDPKYCDVIVKRWQEFTGKAATLEATGETFEEVSHGREARPSATA